MDELEDLKEANILVTEAIKFEGASVCVALTAIILSVFGLISSQLATSMVISLGIPATYLFFMKVILNRDVRIKNILIIILASYIVNVALFIPETWSNLINVSVVFFIGACLSIFIYVIYWTIFKLVRGREMSYRDIFFYVFSPTLIIALYSILVLYLIGVLR